MAELSLSSSADVANELLSRTDLDTIIVVASGSDAYASFSTDLATLPKWQSAELLTRAKEHLERGDSTPAIE